MKEGFLVKAPDNSKYLHVFKVGDCFVCDPSVISSACGTRYNFNFCFLQCILNVV